MSNDDHARRRLEQLTAEQQAEVRAIFADEVARGWVPAPADIEAAIDVVTLGA